ncbi:MAG: purine-nucleoside phosphorylase [Cytophagales bacterium]|nr:purine-nucleoside phosphorylase [Bernardetiaceae bacterium]MDW8210877.1 purine-nucleoside phosphorylase [Cytophagales bacterium]
MTFQRISQAASYIRQLTSLPCYTGIICGTGLSGLAEIMRVKQKISYANIPHFPVSTVESHAGNLLFGEIASHPVVMMQGRMHYYEGYSMSEVVFPVRVMKLLGIKRLFISNAAGGLHSNFQLSDLMIICDHINLHPDNPLRGANIDELGTRFPDMSQPYDPELIALAEKVAEQKGIKLQKGVYVSVSGPNLETPAEYRMLRFLGADAVGMSTVPEVIAARHMDLPVFAVSVITDLCTPTHIQKVTIEGVIAAARKAEPNLQALVIGMLEKIQESS